MARKPLTQMYEDIESESLLSDEGSEISNHLSSVESSEEIHFVGEAGSWSSDEDLPFALTVCLRIYMLKRQNAEM